MAGSILCTRLHVETLAVEAATKIYNLFVQSIKNMYGIIIFFI